MNLNWTIIIVLLGLVNGQQLLSQTGALDARNTAREVPPGEGWQLVWADEFDKDGAPDPRNWIYETGFVRGRELQWYQPENAWCQNGLLIIESRSERKANPNYDPDSPLWRKKRAYAEYTSSSLKTQSLHSWLYGRFEMRARIQASRRLHPCFWTMGIQGDWPNCGEIDIMEYRQGQLRANAAWGSPTNGVPLWKSFGTSIHELGDPAWSTKFHVWRMDWDENCIRLYLDDLVLNTIDVSKAFNGTDGRKNPFRQPHYLILDLAIEKTPVDDPAPTVFPTRFEVDYVRVYQRPPRLRDAGVAGVEKVHR